MVPPTKVQCSDGFSPLDSLHRPASRRPDLLPRAWTFSLCLLERRSCRDLLDRLRPDGDADLPETFIEQFTVPVCQHCNGTLMPDVVFFGGTVPRDRVDKCFQLINSARGLIVIGSSLSVYSGYRFCRHAASQEKPLVILNEGKTRADSMSQYRFSDAPFTLLEKLAQHVTSIQQESAHG